MLEEKIDKDYIDAMKARDKERSSAVSFLRAQLKNHRIDLRVEKLQDSDVITVIKKQIKQRQDSIEQFRKGGREEMAQKEEREMALLKSYLPQELSDDQLKAMVKEAIAQTQATSIKDMGKVMKAVLEKASGRADNKKVGDLVKAALGQ